MTSKNEIEMKFRITKETQLKFLNEVYQTDINAFEKKIYEILQEAEFKIIRTYRKDITDLYYDTEELRLFEYKSLLRIRKIDNNYKLTYKNPISRVFGEFFREEIEISLKKFEYIKELPKELLNDILQHIPPAFQDGVFLHKLTCKNDRLVYEINRDGITYDFSIDRFYFFDNKNERKTDIFFEIEIEIKSGETFIKKHLTDLRTVLQKQDFLTLKFSKKSKYELGATILYLKEKLKKKNVKVFISYGHKRLVNAEVENFVLRNGYEPIILEKLPNDGRTVIEKLEDLVKTCVCAIAIHTKDDELIKKRKRPLTFYRQGRPNVYHEIGYCQGRLGREKIILLHEKGAIIPSNLSGIVRFDFNDSHVKNIFYDLQLELQNIIGK